MKARKKKPKPQALKSWFDAIRLAYLFFNYGPLTVEEIARGLGWTPGRVRVLKAKSQDRIFVSAGTVTSKTTGRNVQRWSLAPISPIETRKGKKKVG